MPSWPCIELCGAALQLATQRAVLRVAGYVVQQERILQQLWSGLCVMRSGGTVGCSAECHYAECIVEAGVRSLPCVTGVSLSGASLGAYLALQHVARLCFVANFS